MAFKIEKCAKCGLYYELPVGDYAPCGHRVWPTEVRHVCKAGDDALDNPIPPSQRK